MDLKRIDTRILKSIILAIYERGTIRKTPLMERIRLDYPRLKSYLNWLELVDFVRVSEQNVALTEHGLKLRTKFLN